MAVSTIEPTNVVKKLNTIGGSSAGTYTSDITETGRYLAIIYRLTSSDSSTMGMYYIMTYLRAGSNASSNRALIKAIITPTSGFTSLTISPSTTEKKATITYTSTSSYCYVNIIRLVM